MKYCQDAKRMLLLSLVKCYIDFIALERNTVENKSQQVKSKESLMAYMYANGDSTTVMSLKAGKMSQHGHL